MLELINDFVLFGRNLLDGTVTSTVLFVVLIEAALLAVILLTLLIIYVAKHTGREKDYYVATTAAAPAEVTLKEIVLDTGAVRRHFVEGDEFDYSGLVVYALYSDGSENEISNYSIDNPDTSAAGEYYVTVRYEDMIAEYDVTVAPKPVKVRSLTSIDVDLADVTTEFEVNAPFTSEGLKVYGNYDEEPYREEIVDYTIDEPNMSVDGSADVVVRYGGMVCDYSVFIRKGRSLVGITLDTSSARTQFALGQFDTDGLLVIAQYDASPYTEYVKDYMVDAPDSNVAGTQRVAVSYKGYTEYYEVSFIAIESSGEMVEEGVIRYDRSFTARLIQSENEVKEWYSEIKNTLLSYRKVKDRMSWKKETFRMGKEKVARMGFRGKVLCLFLALDPSEFADSKYKVEDAADNSSTADTPLLYRIKNDRRAKYAIQLIEIMMEKLGTEKIERDSQDYFLPYEGTLELINKGLIKREVKSSADEAVFRGEQSIPHTEQPVRVEVPEVVEEDSFEGGVLRYDRSFTARLIQSEDDVKQWYSDIKNALLSYKKVKDRMSWKKETYRFNKDKIARMGFRGKVLCLFLALDPAQFADSKFKVEDAAGNSSTADTPLLYRIKNDKRAKYALQLIETMMEQLGAQHFDRDVEDYYMPYEGIMELLKKGLIKREIKTAGEEAVFRSEDKAEKEAAAAVAENDSQQAAEEKSEEYGDSAPDQYESDDVESDGDSTLEWSFKARLISSYDGVKMHYGKLKNALLAYENVESNLNFANETFRFGGEVIAKFAFVDKTLSLLLALDPKVYDGVGYPAEDVSAKEGCQDTPLMFAIRTDRDAHLVDDLLSDLAYKYSLVKYPRRDEDYYEASKDVKALIAEGLIRVHKAN